MKLEAHIPFLTNCAALSWCAAGFPTKPADAHTRLKNGKVALQKMSDIFTKYILIRIGK
ncbi:MAG: hypothetical protein ACLRPX_08895 [Ruthenibacterium sp.]